MACRITRSPAYISEIPLTCGMDGTRMGARQLPVPPIFIADAYRLYPHGCTCRTPKPSCDWHVVAINGPEVAEVEIQ